jgi:MFS family permease
VVRCAWSLAWLLTASVTFLLIGGIVAGLPAWLLGRPEFLVLGFAYAAFICSAAIPLAMASAGQRTHWAFAVLVCVLAFAGVWGFVQLVEVQWPYSLAVTMCGVAILIFLCFPPAGKDRFRKLGWMVVGSALIAFFSLPATLNSWIYRGLERPFSYVVDTSLHRVRINLFREHVPRPEVHGGGLAVAGEHLILVTGDGLF